MQDRPSSLFTASGEKRPCQPSHCLVASMVCGIIVTTLYFLSHNNYLLFHSITELFSIAVAWAAFLIAWNSRERLQDGSLLILGTGLLFVGIVDLLHTVAYKGMGIFSENHANLPTQLWIAGRYLNSCGFLVATLYVSRPIRALPLFGALALLTACLVLAIFTGWFPDCFVEGRGLTGFKIASEYIVCGLMLLSGLRFHRLRRKLDPILLRLLLWAIALTILQELLFTFYVSVLGFSNFLGHIAKIGTYALIYLGVVRVGVAEPQRLLYRDLQENKERLANSEARLNEAQRVAGIGSWEWRADTGVLIWSEQMYRLFDVTPETFVPSGASLRTLFGTLTWGTYMRSLARCLKNNGPCVFETTIRLPGSTGLRHLEISCNAGENGARHPVRILGTVRDITLRKQSDARREDVERILRHDLRSPMASIVSGLQMLAESSESDQQRELLKIMENSGRQVITLVDQSLTLQKIEEGTYNPGNTRVNLAQLLAQIREETRHLCTSKGLTFSLHVPGTVNDGIQPATQGDATLLQSMLSNLVVNALEASPENGTVTVSITTPETPTITIHNQGRVPENIQQRFFEKYATSGKTTGTGLGTYSARLIAEAHGGNVQMRTSSEHGTTLTVRLPGINR